jgi:superfamily II DNA helicase RecQ
MGLRAVAVNGETYTEQLYDVGLTASPEFALTSRFWLQEIRAFTYRILLSGPEMALYHPRFSRAIRDSVFMSHFQALIFDEAHLIPQWGVDFREAYFEVGRLRSLFPQNCPVLATTATVTSQDVKIIEKVLHLQQETMYYINLGNDRPNISQAVKQIQSLQRYTEIYEIIDRNSTHQWPSTMVFANTIDEVRAITHALRQRYPQQRELIDSYHSRRRRSTKQKVMDRFREGEMRILCTTEAAGMVC